MYKKKIDVYTYVYCKENRKKATFKYQIQTRCIVLHHKKMNKYICIYKIYRPDHHVKEKIRENYMSTI